MMGTDMVSLRRRQVIIGSLAAAVAPATFAAFPAAEAPLLFSGRVVDARGEPVAGAEIFAGQSTAHSDADGRFVLRATSRSYRVVSADGVVTGTVTGGRPDDRGTWRATVSLTL